MSREEAMAQMALAKANKRGREQGRYYTIAEFDAAISTAYAAGSADEMRRISASLKPGRCKKAIADARRPLVEALARYETAVNKAVFLLRAAGEGEKP